MTDQKGETVVVRMDPQLHADIKRVAAETERSMSQVVRYAVRQLIERYDKWGDT